MKFLHVHFFRMSLIVLFFIAGIFTFQHVRPLHRGYFQAAT